MFNNLKLILLFVCVFGFMKTESKYLGKRLFKRGVVVGDDQYIKGQITSGRHEDIIIGSKSAHVPQYIAPVPQYSAPAGYGAGVGAGAGAGVNAGYNRNAGYSRLSKRATTVIRSPNGVYIGQGNTFGDGKPSGASAYAGSNAGVGAGAGAGRGAYSQPSPAASPIYADSAASKPAPSTTSQHGAGYHDNQHGKFSTSSGYSSRPASGYNDGIQIGDRNTIEGGIRAH